MASGAVHVNGVFGFDQFRGGAFAHKMRIAVLLEFLLVRDCKKRERERERETDRQTDYRWRLLFVHSTNRDIVSGKDVCVCCNIVCASSTAHVCFRCFAMAAAK